MDYRKQVKELGQYVKGSNNEDAAIYCIMTAEPKDGDINTSDIVIATCGSLTNISHQLFRAMAESNELAQIHLIATATALACFAVKADPGDAKVLNATADFLKMAIGAVKNSSPAAIAALS